MTQKRAGLSQKKAGLSAAASWLKTFQQEKTKNGNRRPTVVSSKV